jgi:hypothetical protein
MLDRIIYDAAYVKSQINQLKIAFPELLDDYEVLESAIDGETNFERVIEVITDEFLEALSMKGAIADRMESLRERSDRFGRKAESIRSLALDLMQAANRQKVELPIATLSLRKGVNSAVVDDVTQLPQGFTRTEVLPLKTEIKKALEAGQDVPGAHLEHGPEGLSVRTK